MIQSRGWIFVSTESMPYLFKLNTIAGGWSFGLICSQLLYHHPPLLAAQLPPLLSLSLSTAENLCPFNKWLTKGSVVVPVNPLMLRARIFFTFCSYTESAVVEMGPGFVLKLKVNPQLPLTWPCKTMEGLKAIPEFVTFQASKILLHIPSTS